jgi:kynurenine formamidase
MPRDQLTYALKRSAQAHLQSVTFCRGSGEPVIAEGQSRTRDNRIAREIFRISKEMKHAIWRVLIRSATVLTALLCGCATTLKNATLKEVGAMLQQKRFVDLTHAFEPGIPHWPGFPDEQRELLYWYEAGKGKLGAGFFAEEYHLVGQWGTHVDPPAHFIGGLRTVDQIGLKEMILPLVIIDVHEQVAVNPDYTVELKDIKAWEAKHGAVPKGSFVALRTDWSKRWPDMARMQNKDSRNVAHYPGWSLPVLRYLYEQRHITASGHETTDTDPGLATSREDYSLETYVLGQNHYQIELLTNLDQVPESGALVVVSFPKPKGGSGFAARVFAIIP